MVANGESLFRIVQSSRMKTDIKRSHWTIMMLLYLKNKEKRGCSGCGLLCSLGAFISEKRRSLPMQNHVFDIAPKHAQ